MRRAGPFERGIENTSPAGTGGANASRRKARVVLLGQAREGRPGDRDLRNPGTRRPAAEQRVGLIEQASELGALHPGVLDELELAREVRGQADEMQPALLVGALPGCSASSGESRSP